MKQNLKRENSAFSFSYLDVFFLLILGLVLSVVLYFVLETPALWGGEESFHVGASAYLDRAVFDSIPAPAEMLLDGEGKEIGKILSVQKEIRGDRVFCKMTLEMKGADFKVGQKIRVETRNFVSDFWIYSVLAEEK